MMHCTANVRGVPCPHPARYRVKIRLDFNNGTEDLIKAENLCVYDTANAEFIAEMLSVMTGKRNVFVKSPILEALSGPLS